MYFIYWPVFLKLMRCMFSPRYFSIRLILFVGLLIIPAILTIRVIVLFFQGLDYLLFPGFQKQKVTQPVFILSNPRSGSTFLHRLLEKDGQFTFFTLWQSLFNSITLYRIVEFFALIDKTLGSPLVGLFKIIDRYTFKGWDGIHKTGLRYSEEDEFLFVNLFLSPGLILFFPYLHETPDVFALDSLPEKVKNKVVKNIKRAVQRQVYASGGKIFLAKNATAGGRLGIYREAFPDMRTVCIESDIVRSVSSSLSVFTKPWSLHSPKSCQRKSDSLIIVEMVRTNHQGILDHRKHTPENQLFEILYHELVDYPESTVKSIYRYFDLPLSEHYLHNLMHDCYIARNYRSNHSYCIDDYGLTGEAVEKYFASNEPNYVELLENA